MVSDSDQQHSNSPKPQCKDSEPKSNPPTPSRRITRHTATQNPGDPNSSSTPRQVKNAPTNYCVEIPEETMAVVMNKADLYKHLCSSFPGRHTQIRELLNLVGGPRDFMPPLLVYGGPSCGKTSVILEMFKHLGRPHAYASCRSCFSPRLLFESLLNQLLSHKRTVLNNYGSAKRCERIGDFVEYLREACVGKKFQKKMASGCKESSRDFSENGASAGFEGSESQEVLGLGFTGTQKELGKRAKVSELESSAGKDGSQTPKKGSKDRGHRGSPQKSTGKVPKGSGNGNTVQEKWGSDSGKEVGGLDYEVVYLIFDNVELLHEWNNGFGLISALFKLSDLMRMPNLGVIFISNIGPDTFYGNTGALEPLPVYFKDYTDDELYQILLKGKPNPELYASFLNAVLKPFSRACRRVTELSTALEPLFEKYSEPIGKEAVVTDEKGKRRLFALLEPHIAPALNQIFNVPTYSGMSESGGDRARRKVLTKRPGFDEAVDDLDFHLSVCGKYLLISAFIASRNPATLDATLFDSTGGLDTRKRRRSTVSATEKKERKAQEEILKGPGSFPLERLLAIFQCITATTDEDLENQQSADTFSIHEGNMELMSDALMQLSTLCNINFLYKGSSCPLEGAARYRSNIDQELAMRIARSVGFPLSKYLYR